MVRAVDGVDLVIDRGETLGVVGESSCGKTVTAMTVLKLIQMPPGRIIHEGSVLLGRAATSYPRRRWSRQIRSKQIAIIFQEPMTSLNPVYTVGQQIAETIRQHEDLNRREAMDRTVEMLRLVNIPTPERRVHDYPHQFSGGMRQRVMIAMALSCNPKLLLADEPTTALDVTIQAQILDLLAEMKSRLGWQCMLITHAMGVVAETAQRVVVMCWPRGQKGDCPSNCSPVRCALHAGPDPLDPAHRQGRRQASAARGNRRRRGAKPDRSAARLSLRAALRSALPACTEAMPELHSRGGPQGRLHPVSGGAMNESFCASPIWSETSGEGRPVAARRR